MDYLLFDKMNKVFSLKKAIKKYWKNGKKKYWKSQGILSVRKSGNHGHTLCNFGPGSNFQMTKIFEFLTYCEENRDSSIELYHSYHPMDQCTMCIRPVYINPLRPCDGKLWDFLLLQEIYGKISFNMDITHVTLPYMVGRVSVHEKSLKMLHRSHDFFSKSFRNGKKDQVLRTK